MTSNRDIFTLMETRSAFEDAGLVGGSFMRELSLASFEGLIVSHGFQSLNIEGKVAADVERSPLTHGRTWRFFSSPFRPNALTQNRYTIISTWEDGCLEYRVNRAGPRDKRPPATVQCWVECVHGELGWQLRGWPETVEQRWASVMFDRYSVEKFLSDYKKQGQPLTIPELMQWIAECNTANYKTAWKKLVEDFGSRAGKKQVFIDLWPKKSVGRPEKSVSSVTIT